MNEPDPPRRGLDPLALKVLGAALALAIGLAVWLFVAIRSAPDAPRDAGPGIASGLVDAARSLLRRVEESARPAPPATQSSTSAPAPGKRGIELAAGRSWTYAVRLEPEVWRDATLTYRTVAEQGALVVHTEFRHAQGRLSFRLGPYVAAHASHAQLRFPGFFMHGAYFEFPLAPGRKFSWTYPWQMPDNRVRADRVRRFDAAVGASESVSVPAGRYDAMRIDAVLSYVDAGRTIATVNETLWYAPSIRQIVKVVRDGRSPDEAGRRIVAELADSR